MRRIFPIIVIIILLGGGYWWYTQSTVTALGNEDVDNQLIGSGSIEAETVIITGELGGRITQLHVDEGDEVETGQLLIELDTSDLLAQQVQLEAAVLTAKANLELTSAPPRVENVRLAEAQLVQAEQAEAGAKLVWQQAEQLARDPHQIEAQINQMRAQVTEAEKKLEMTRVQLKRAEIKAEAASRDQHNNFALAENEAAQYELQGARHGIQIAKTALAGLKQQVEHLVRLRDNPLALVAQANTAEAAHKQALAAVQAAQANLVAAKAEPAPEEVNVARAQLQEAETGLDIVAVQLEKQTLKAPRAGLISQRLVKAGELATPGLALLELSDIDTVDLTVYIPDTQIGRVKLGQQAAVMVDAYPGDIFDGHVTFIAHEAEFTPRNVQTKEERVNLVFAVKITIDNSDHRLKPGMPADAEILPGTESEEIVATGHDTGPTTTPTPDPVTPQPPSPTPKPATTVPTATPTVTPAPVLQAQIVASGLKVREGPGIDFERIAYLSQEDIVVVLDVDPVSGWLHVNLPGGDQSGWISGSPSFVTLLK
jgi:multidrug resistance efflux pump